MTGKELFEMYVRIGLCTSFTYEFEYLSPALQGRWNRWAEALTKAAPDLDVSKITPY